MKSNNKRNILNSFIFVGLIATILTSCDTNNNNDTPIRTPPSSEGPPATTTGSGTSVDRLARPAINEGLIITDDLLNAFNSAPPSAHLSDAAASVRTEAVAVLTAFKKLGTTLRLSAAPEPSVTAGAFLPDVMRIDTRVSIPPGKMAYNAATSGDKGILTGGRKLEDDVMDITLSFLVAGDASGAKVKDNVQFSGVAGNPNQPGHKMLIGQTSRGGKANFPFVAGPN